MTKKLPSELENERIEQLLSHLAADLQVSAATQNQALCALIFIHKHVICREIVGLNYSFTKKPRRTTILDVNEVNQIIHLMSEKYRLITALLYGAGFRINEALKLRIKEINFTNNTEYPAAERFSPPLNDCQLKISERRPCTNNFPMFIENMVLSIVYLLHLLN